MLKMKRHILLIVLTVWLLLAITGATTPPTVPWPFDVEQEVIPYPGRGGPVTLRLTIVPRLGEYDRFAVEITGIDNLTYDGPTTVEVESPETGSTVFELALVIPDNDTCGIEYTVRCSGLPHPDAAYWVVSEDTAKFYRGNPRLILNPDLGQPPGRGLGIADSLHALAVAKAESSSKRYHLDKNGKMITMEEHMSRKEEHERRYAKFVPGDTTVVWHRDSTGALYPVKKSDLPTSAEKKKQEMRELEKEPLEEYESQVVMLNDTVWVRNRGETEFRIAPLHAGDSGVASRCTPMKGPFDIDMEPTSALATAGSTTFQFTFSPRYPAFCSTGVTVTISTVGGVTLLGDTLWSVDLDNAQPFSTMLEVHIPENDTSGLTIKLRCEGAGWTCHPTFVTTGDTVEFWPGNPRYVGSRKEVIRGELVYAGDSISDTLTSSGLMRRRTESLGPPAHRDTLTDQEREIMDSLLIDRKLQDRRQRMKELEETPLSGARSQLFYVGDEVWIRNEGEREFHLAEPLTENEMWMQYTKDALTRMHPGPQYTIIIQLDDAAKLETAATIVDSLNPWGTDGAYEAVVNKAQAAALAEAGLRFYLKHFEQ